MNLLHVTRNRSYNMELATRIGLNEALFLCQLDHWLSSPNTGKKYAGKKYIRMKISEWEEQFPFWSGRTIRRIIKKCEDEGWMVSDKLNGHWSNTTKWYTIDYGHEIFTMDYAPPGGAEEEDGVDNLSGLDVDNLSGCQEDNMSGLYNQECLYKNENQYTVDVSTVMGGWLESPGEKLESFKLDPKNGSSLSVWYRLCLQQAGHTKGTLPDLTVKDKGQLKQLMARLGDDGPDKVRMALDHWDAFSRFAKEEFHMMTYKPTNIQKLVMLAPALSEFEPPEVFDPGDGAMKSVEEALNSDSKQPLNPDLEL